MSVWLYEKSVWVQAIAWCQNKKGLYTFDAVKRRYMPQRVD